MPIPFLDRHRRTGLIAVATSLLAFTGAGALVPKAMASTYPDKPISVVVGFAPGGTNDILARLIAIKLQEKLKQGVIVDNKPGANSAIGTGFVSKAKPDGYTLLVSSSGGLTVNPVVMKSLSYDPVKDFEPIALLGSYPLIVTVPADLKVQDLKGLIGYAKQNKGGTLDHAVGSSSFQLAAETLATAAGLQLNQIPYRGSGPAVTALLGQEVQLGVLDSAAVMAQVKAGKLKAIAVTTAKRSKAFPDIPTVAESGYPGYDVTIWTALMAPKGLPKPAMARLRASLAEILKDKDTIEKMIALGMEPGNVDSDALSLRINQDIARWKNVARAANIQAE